MTAELFLQRQTKLYAGTLANEAGCGIRMHRYTSPRSMKRNILRHVERYTDVTLRSTLHKDAEHGRMRYEKKMVAAHLCYVRNARAISSVVRAQTSRSVSATCPFGGESGMATDKDETEAVVLVSSFW